MVKYAKCGSGKESNMTNENTALIIPFGKYKGRTVDEVIELDPNYRQWLLGQAWLAEKFVELHTALLNSGKQIDDTPEHNLLQARFLDDRFVKAFLKTIDREIEINKIEFEVNGIDVLIHGCFAIELKPLLGDDYPNVIRQIGKYKNNRSMVSWRINNSRYRLLDGNIVSLGGYFVIAEKFYSVVPLRSVKEIFASSGIKLIMLNEIEDNME